MEKLVFRLVDMMKGAEASDVHFAMNNIKHTEGLTAVVSVYDQRKPAHMVLDELYEWAESNNEEVKALIDELREDMSWNKDHPV